ncbi:CAP-Gly domain protein [Oesophagostomum dentatum]|uniref:Tubulin-specific chaperone E n=1 Tax=Oesophagostomum dentatum TaxID=61180 RepID=A0A0B1TDV7_OESDE|nr:CAP-Gly domain protein [Oesophagostomum dentatum]
MVELGDRVLVGGNAAVVRYVGNVDGHAGVWVGVEWDDSSRGKHDGCVNGVRYFQTSAPKGGSLVKIQNVCLGVDLLTAVLKRYADDIDENVFVVSTKAVELVGMQSTSMKQSNVHRLTHIVLECCAVAKPPPDTCAPFKRCISLNLFNNLLWRWDDVHEILKYFPILRELVLRKNRMEPAKEGPTWQDVDHLQELVISDCGITSESATNILRFLPNLRVVHAVDNRLTAFHVPDLAENITALDLGSNPIRCLSNISGNLRRLEKLSVADCGIENILILENAFPSLKILNIKDNVISEWSSVNQLQRLPKLSVLYMDCEHLKCVPGIDVHEVIIAKLAGLVDLNRFDVSSVERQSAEVRFLDKYFATDEATKADHTKDIERLTKIHGTGAADAKSCGLNVLSLSVCHEGKTVKRRLPLAITVQKLTEMVARVFSVDTINVKLILDKGTYQVELDNPMRPLDFYSPEPDDTLRLVPIESNATMSTEPISEQPAPKQIYRHIIRCGVRLCAKNRTVCSAIMMMHRLLEREIGSVVCRYTLATACIVLATKLEEDRDIGVRDVINASHRILHPDGDPAKLDDHMYELLAAYLDILRSWMPDEFTECPIADSCSTMLRDCYSDPELVLSHSSQSLVIAVISLVLKGLDISVPHSHNWYEVLHKSMTEQRLRKIEVEIICDVYGLEFRNE